MDQGLDFGNAFISKDEICNGTDWHTRKNPADPAHEPYFPIDQAALTMTARDGTTLDVALKTLTPNFKTFQIRIDGGTWTDGGATATWKLHGGSNRFEARSTNRFGVPGPVSALELEM
jgi:hypothetical protein